MADVTKVQASDGTIYTINDEDDYTKDEIDALLADKADVGVSYTKTEDDALLDGKADKDATYTKTEVDDLLDTKAGVGDSYTKAEDDTLLDAKADKTDVEDALLLKADKADTYTKSEADTLLADKADVGDSYTKAEDDALLADKADSTDVYSKTETDTLLADKADTSSVVGFPDYTDIQKEFTSSSDFPYTATEDGWLIGIFIAANSTSAQVTINGVKVAWTLDTQYARDYGQVVAPIKSGDIIGFVGSGFSIAGMGFKLYNMR